MATDRLGQTVATGEVYVLAGTCRRVDGDNVLLVVGQDGAEHQLRVRAGEIQKADHVVNIKAVPSGAGTTFQYAPSSSVAASVPQHLVRLQEVNDLFDILTTAFLGYLAGKADLVHTHAASEITVDTSTWSKYLGFAAGLDNLQDVLDALDDEYNP